MMEVIVFFGEKGEDLSETFSIRESMQKATVYKRIHWEAVGQDGQI